VIDITAISEMFEI